MGSIKDHLCTALIANVAQKGAKNNVIQITTANTIIATGAGDLHMKRPIQFVANADQFWETHSKIIRDTYSIFLFIKIYSN